MTVEMVKLRREPICAGSAVRVLELPKWIGPSRDGVYWHIPRAAQDFGDRLAIQMWCGVSFNSVRRLVTGVPPRGAMCGTCVGRHNGAEGVDGLVFTPRDRFAVPRLCPGELGDGGVCIACGERVRPWLDRAVRHAPGPAFESICRPCPDHGWSDVRARDGRLICGTFVGSGWDNCDFECGPSQQAVAT